MKWGLGVSLYGSNPDQCVRFMPKADIAAHLVNARFTSKGGHWLSLSRITFSAAPPAALRYSAQSAAHRRANLCGPLNYKINAAEYLTLT